MNPAVGLIIRRFRLMFEIDFTRIKTFLQYMRSGFLNI